MKVNPTNKKIFDKIFYENKWGDNDSRSGSGSNLQQTLVLRETLPHFFSKHKIKSVLDIPCGDFHWMKEIKLNLHEVLDRYIGSDIVIDIVSSNNAKFGDSKFTFQLLDLTISPLPKVDLILSRDCLVHLSYNHIYKALSSIKKSGSIYLLTTSFIDRSRTNKNAPTGGWRPLNFQKFPFFFSHPRDMIIENCTEDGGIYADKALMLWEVKKINLLPLSIVASLFKLKKLVSRLKTKK